MACLSKLVNWADNPTGNQDSDHSCDRQRQETEQHCGAGITVDLLHEIGFGNDHNGEPINSQLILDGGDFRKQAIAVER